VIPEDEGVPEPVLVDVGHEDQQRKPDMVGRTQIRLVQVVLLGLQLRVNPPCPGAGSPASSRIAGTRNLPGMVIMAPVRMQR